MKRSKTYILASVFTAVAMAASSALAAPKGLIQFSRPSTSGSSLQTSSVARSFNKSANLQTMQATQLNRSAKLLTGAQFKQLNTSGLQNLNLQPAGKRLGARQLGTIVTPKNPKLGSARRLSAAGCLIRARSS
jgi:hypothetical protein